MDGSGLLLLIVGQLLNAMMVVVGFISLYKTIQYTRWSKTIDITNTYLRRFAELLKESEAASKDDLERDLFWQQFWYLQQDQFYLWKRGLIDSVFFEVWMEYRVREWETDRFGQLEGYREGYHKVSKDLTPEFRKFIESVFSRSHHFQRRVRGHA